MLLKAILFEDNNLEHSSFVFQVKELVSPSEVSTSLLVYPITQGVPRSFTRPLLAICLLREPATVNLLIAKRFAPGPGTLLSPWPQGLKLIMLCTRPFRLNSVATELVFFRAGRGQAAGLDNGLHVMFS
jgi:hypothetical protein